MSEQWTWMPSRATSKRPSRRSKGSKACWSRKVSSVSRKRGGGGEELGVEAVEQVADGVVLQDGLDPEECLAVGALVGVLHLALEGRGLEEEGREGAAGGIDDPVLLVGAGAGIGELGGCCAEAGEERIENADHPPWFEAARRMSETQKLDARSALNSG